MRLLIPFWQQNPERELSRTFSDRFLDLFEEGIDVAVRIGGAGTLPASLGCKHLGREKMVFCAAPAYLHAHGRPQTVEELLQHQAILYERVDGSVKPWLFITEDNHLHWRTVPFRMALGDVDAQVQAVCAGLGVAQSPTWLIRDQLARGELEIVLPERQPDGLPLTLIWPRRKQLLPKVDALLNALSALDIAGLASS